MQRAYFFSILIFLIPTFSSAQIYTSGNGLTTTGSGTNTNVSLGGTLSANTSVDLGSSFKFTLSKSAEEFFTVLNNGNVGIGAPNPNGKLTIVNGSSAAVFLNSSLGLGNLIYFNGVNGTNLSFNMYTPSTGDLKTRLGINYAVHGGNGYTDYAIVGSKKSPFLELDSENGSISLYGENGTGSDWRSPNLNLGLSVGSNGKVGIGTNSPETQLEVKSPDYNAMTLYRPFNSLTGSSGIDFSLNNASGSRVVYAHMAGGISSNTSGDEKGLLSFHVRSGTSLSEAMRISGAGNVGIGTSVPEALLHLNTASSSANELFKITDPTAAGAYLKLTDITGVPNHFVPGLWGKAIGSGGDRIGLFLIAEPGTDEATSPAIVLDGRLNGAAIVNSPVLRVSNVNTPLLEVKANGNVGIGTTNPQAKLAVKGNVFAEKVKVTLAASDWPDYVFNKNYKLRPLPELQSFIDKHHHLPEVPSASAIKNDGLDVGENQAMLLKKIEELTLYILEQNKRIEHLEKVVQKKRAK